MEEKRGGTWNKDATCLLSGHFTDVNRTSTQCLWPLKKQHRIIGKVTVKDTFKGEVQATSCSDCTADLF